MSSYQINGQAASPEAFTRLACDPTRNVVVEACAGSGKTHLLVERMLNVLASGTPAQSVLAITFTKKAAAEMRQRLTKRLSEAANHGLYKQLLAQGRGVDIRTFHSWFASLLRLCPHAVLVELGLPATFELVEDNAELRSAAWQGFFETLLATPALLESFNASVEDIGRTTTLAALDEVLNRRSEFWLAQGAGIVASSQPDWRELHPALAGGESPEQALWTRLGLIEQLEVAQSELCRASGKTSQKAGQAMAAARGARDFEGLVSALLTQKGEARKLGENPDVWAAQELVLLGLKAQSDAAQQAHHVRMHAMALALVQAYRAAQMRLQQVDLQEVELAAVRLLQDATLGAWMAEKLDARLSQVLIDEFQDTNPLQWQAISQWLDAYAGAGAGLGVFIVGDPKQSIYGFRGAQAGVFDAAKAFMQHAMGADFLSTDHTRRCASEVVSALNASLGPLAALAADAPLAFPAFRAHTTDRADPPGTSPQVVCLPKVMRPTSRSVARADTVGWPSAFEPRLGQVELAVADLARAAETEQVAHWIGHAVAQGRAPNDFLVLARKRVALAGLGAALAKHGVPFVQHAERSLADTTEVQDVLALLDALASPGHELSLARALKSPIFGWNDDNLCEWAIWAKTQSGSSWLELLLKSEQQTQWNRWQFANLVLKTAQALRRYAHWTHDLPPHDALARIFADPGVNEGDGHWPDLPTRFVQAAPLNAQDAVLSNLHTLLGAALNVGAGRFLTMYSLVRSLKRAGLKAAAIHQADAALGMTIHAAKGLQAKVVILMDADPQRTPDSVAGMRVCWPAQSAVPAQLVFVRPNHQPGFLQGLLDQQAAQARAEQLNVLYVAMTRAQDGLVISAHEPHRPGDLRPWELLCAVLPVVAVPTHTHAGVEAGVGTVAVKNMPNWHLASTFIEFDATKNIAPELTTVQRARAVGEAVHLLLQWLLPQSGPISVTLEAALAAAQRHGLVGAEVGQSRQLAEQMAQGQGAWLWQSSRLLQSASEVDFFWGGQALRADRVIQDAEGRWAVVDYKTSGALCDPDNHGVAFARAAAQVGAYAQALAMSLKQPVDAWLLLVNGDCVRVN